MTDRFDPKPDKPYAKCRTCEFIAETEAEMSAHTNETLAASPERRSHSYQVTNPARQDAINREVRREADDAIENAITEFLDRVYRLHRREGVAIEELTAAVKRAHADVDFLEAWNEYIKDEDDD